MYQNPAIHRSYLSDRRSGLTFDLNAGRSLARLKAAMANALSAWRKRSSDPLRLYGLNDHVLNDIGLSRTEIGQGPAESFWRV